MKHTLSEPPHVGARKQLDHGKGMTRKDRLELVDLLRKNLLYQTPRPVFGDGDEPTHVDVRMLSHHYGRILELLTKAGGWTMPEADKRKLLELHEERARRAIGDGVDYDFDGLDYGDLLAMHSELEGVEELEAFRTAIGGEISKQQEERHDRRD